MTKRTRWMVAVAGIGLLVFVPGLIELIRLSMEQRRLDHRLAQLEAERTRLAKEQERLESDPAYVEGLIRSTFKVAKPGEVVVPLDSDEKSRKAR